MSDSPIKFPSSPSSSEDELPSHHSSEENVPSDDRMPDYSPLWSSKKEDLEEEEDEEEEEEDNDDFDSPPPTRVRRAWSSRSDREDHI